MPEERGLYPSMLVGEQLEYLGRLHGMSAPCAASATTAWLERLGVADRAASKVESLSHGNQQRAQLAAALLHGPELLVLGRSVEPGRGGAFVTVRPVQLLTAAIGIVCTVGVAMLATSVYRRAILRTGPRVRLRSVVPRATR